MSTLTPPVAERRLSTPLTEERRLIPCSNSHQTGCVNYVSHRGNILCDSCTEARKTLLKSRREQDMEEMISETNRYKSIISEQAKTIADLEKQNQHLISSNKELVTTTDSRYKDYHVQLEKDGRSLLSLNEKLCKENEVLTREKSAYEMTYEQVKLDIEQLRFENEGLKKQNTILTEQNNALLRENKLLSESENVKVPNRTKTDSLRTKLNKK